MIGRRTKALVAKLCFLAALVTSAGILAPAQEQVPSGAPGNSGSRPCSANPVLAYTPSKKNAKKLKHPPPPEPPPACIEVKGEPLGIQEFLQNLAREQAWKIGENRASEDMWSFVRYFNPDELDAYAETKVTIEPVKFTGGKAVTTVRTTDIGGDFVRVQVSAHIQADGTSTDPTWKQPTSVWPLASKGVFEQELLTALQTRYQPIN